MAGVDFNKLTADITKQLTNHSPVIVAISGFGGSGKSTLADRLRDHFQLDDLQVIRIDHLYSDHADGPGILDQVDWELLIHILKDARAHKPLSYVGRGYRGEAINIEAELPTVLIVEGIRLLQPRLLPLFDITIWIDCPQDIALARAKTRDRAQGEDEMTVSLWDTDWGSKDSAYFKSYRPDQLAAILYPSTFLLP